MEAYYLTFDIVCDEIENRVFEAAAGINDYSLCNVISQLVTSFALDFPDETAAYGLDVIEAVFNMMSENSLNNMACEPDYLSIEEEYYTEGTQLSFIF